MYPLFHHEGLRRLGLALGCGLLLALVFAPPLGAFLAWSRLPEAGAMLEVRRGASVLLQAQSPGIEIPDTLHAVIRWRLLFPLLGYGLGLPAWALFGLAPAGVLAVLGYLLARLRREGAGWGAGAQVLLVLGAGSWFFTSTGWLGYYDSWLAFGLLVAALAGPAWPVWVACVLTPWIDERFLLAAPLALGCRYWWRRERAASAAGAGADGGTGAGTEPQPTAAAARTWWGLAPREWGWHYLGPVAVLAFFAVVRLLVLPAARGTDWAGYVATQNNLAAPAVVLAWGVWEGLRCGWLFAVVAVWWAWRSRPAVGAGLGATALATIVVGLSVAQDFSRSMTMLLPLAAVGALLAVRRRAAWLPRALAVAVPVALLLPAHHVMSDRVNPIYYLYHELYVLANPPRALQPERYELQGIHLMEQGDMAGAEEQLTRAIRLAENPANPSKHRGLLRAGQQRWREAREDFTVMTTHEPKNPEGWFLRAQAAAALRDGAAARADLQQALAVAPAAWAQRPDVARFRARLEASR